MTRLFHTGVERWVLKGGYAPGPRLGTRARTIQNLDLNVPPPPIENLLNELQQAAEVDLGDFFEFRIEQA